MEGEEKQQVKAVKERREDELKDRGSRRLLTGAERKTGGEVEGGCRWMV